MVFPPSIFSEPDILKIIGNSLPHFSLIASMTSINRRALFSNEPPYSSVRLFFNGLKKDPNNIYPCAQ